MKKAFTVFEILLFFSILVLMFSIGLRVFAKSLRPMDNSQLELQQGAIVSTDGQKPAFRTLGDALSALHTVAQASPKTVTVAFTVGPRFNSEDMIYERRITGDQEGME